MKVAVLCRRLDGKPSNGFERYYHNIVEALGLAGCEPYLPNQAGRPEIRPSGSLISPPYYDIILPAVLLMKGKMKADVFHALTDSQAIMFPWLRGRKVLTIHHVDKTPPDSVAEGIFRAFYNLGTRIGLRHADQIICISSQTKAEVMEAYGVPEERLTVVNQALPSSFRLLPDVPKQATVGYIGALKKRKNVELLVRAYGAYRSRGGRPPLRLAIYGEGSDQPELEALARELGVADGVEFHPPVPQDLLVETYNSFSLFVLPSLQEGFGMPIIEAQSCGVPVLTKEGAMIPEEVVKGTVRCADERDMADQMENLLRDDQWRQKVIKEGLEHAAAFSLRELGARTLAVYRKAYGEGRS